MNVSKFLRVAMPTRTHLLSIFRNPNLRHYSGSPDSDLASSENKMLQIAQNKKIHVDQLNDTISTILMRMQYLDPETLQKIDIVGDVKIITDSKKVLEKLVDLDQVQQISFVGDEGKSGVTPEPLILSLKSPPVVSKLVRTEMSAQSLADLIKWIMAWNKQERFHFHGPDRFPVTLPKHFKSPEYFKVKGIPANIRFTKIRENQFWRIELTPKLITVEKVDHFY